MEKGRARRKDVAELAEVSETVVSYVINQNRYVKQEKRDRVLAAMEELNYRPNRFARALKGKSNKHIAMLIDRIRTEAFGELISDIEKFSGSLGYLVSVSIIDNTEEYVSRITDWQIDGVIISSINFSETYIQKIVDTGVPVVLMENRDYSNVKGAAKINTGLAAGTKKSVRFLHDSGCKNIIYVDRISSHGHFSDMSDFRYAAYCEEMEHLGLMPRVISHCMSLTDLQDKLMTQMQLQPFDGAFCRNDEIASIVMNTLLRKGYRIPEDISIIGLDDTTYSKVSYPTLSTLRLPREEIAKTAIALIEEHNNDNIRSKGAQFEPELILRESVRRRTK